MMLTEERKEEMLSGLRSSSKGRCNGRLVKFDCAVTAEDINWVEFCPITGLKLNYTAGFHGPEKATFDRVNNELGYLPGNVRVISFRANAVKGSLNLETAARIVAYMASSSGEK